MLYLFVSNNTTIIAKLNKRKLELSTNYQIIFGNAGLSVTLK